MTLEDARAQYFARNGFSIAEYQARWVRVRVGRMPIMFPNVRSRRRAIPFHDLHHVLTGYGTDIIGEAELGAWELAATFGERGGAYWAAWLLNTSAMMIGLVLAPRRVVSAFRRGRACTSVYGLGWSNELLARDVDDLRHQLGLRQAALD